MLQVLILPSMIKALWRSGIAHYSSGAMSSNLDVQDELFTLLDEVQHSAQLQRFNYIRILRLLPGISGISVLK